MIRTYTIRDEIGLHARPASVLVDAATKHQNESFILYGGKRVTLKSILAVMSLGVPYGHDIQIEVEGENPEVVLDALEKVLEEQKVI